MICMFISRARELWVVLISAHECSCMPTSTISKFHLPENQEWSLELNLRFLVLAAHPRVVGFLFCHQIWDAIDTCQQVTFGFFLIPATPVPLLNHRLGMISPWSLPHCGYHRYYFQVQSHEWLNLAPLRAPQPNLLPNSSYLYLDFHFCSMMKLNEHSREIY